MIVLERFWTIPILVIDTSQAVKHVCVWSISLVRRPEIGE
jgi:hypothetical protein